MSERIKVVDGPWPERIGCEGVIVRRPPTIYPWSGLGKHEVVVLLDDDPLPTGARGWSCVIDHRALALVNPSPGMWCPACERVHPSVIRTGDTA